MFQIKIHPIEMTTKLIVEVRKKRAFDMRIKLCQKYREALLEKITESFKVDEIDETLYLKFYTTNDKIKKDYSFIKNKKFKSQLRHFVEELHSGVGLIF
jgi:hypothetical protein